MGVKCSLPAWVLPAISVQAVSDGIVRVGEGPPLPPLLPASHPFSPCAPIPLQSQWTAAACLRALLSNRFVPAVQIYCLILDLDLYICSCQKRWSSQWPPNMKPVAASPRLSVHRSKRRASFGLTDLTLSLNTCIYFPGKYQLWFHS